MTPKASLSALGTVQWRTWPTLRDYISRGNLQSPALFWTLAGGSWVRCVGGAGMPKGEAPPTEEQGSREGARLLRLGGGGKGGAQ